MFLEIALGTFLLNALNCFGVGVLCCYGDCLISSCHGMIMMSFDSLAELSSNHHCVPSVCYYI